MLVDNAALDDQRRTAIRFRLWILASAVPSLLIASGGGLFNFAVVWETFKIWDTSVQS